jgi:hypothetical protein
MVCNHCSSASHVTGYQDCPNYCTVCKDAGHGRKSKACPNRTCPDRVCSACNSSLHKTSKSSDCPYHQCSTCDEIGHSEQNCPDAELCSLCEQQGHTEANCPDRLCSACNSSKHKTSRASDCPYHQCSTCDEIGHSEKHCPQAECDVCNLFGHVDTICPFRDCWDVAIDWLNILLMCRTQFTISAYFSDGEVTCSLNDLRIDGTLREFADWQQVQDLCALDGTQIMELKRASLLFKRHENRTYESLQRKLDKPSNHPIHFAFATYQVDAARTRNSPRPTSPSLRHSSQSSTRTTSIQVSSKMTAQ